MDVEDEKKEELMTRLGISNSDLENQIHIPIGYDIFNFEFKQIEKHKLPEHFNVFDAMAGTSRK